MRMVKDLTGRLRHRPYYESDELDKVSQALVSAFLVDRYGEARFPILTDDLGVLVEEHASRLDLYADLTPLGEGIEGVTTFFRGRRPEVQIARELSESRGRDHRLRMTLAHELGHVVLHAPLWGSQELTLDLWAESGRAPVVECHRDRLHSASVDWLEWQAFYAGSGVLMPKAEVVALLGGSRALVAPGSAAADERVALISVAFGVSVDAARIRLQQLGYLLQQDALPLSV
jgi:IrrE N-terminal-like domain